MIATHGKSRSRLQPELAAPRPTADLNFNFAHAANKLQYDANFN